MANRKGKLIPLDTVEKMDLQEETIMIPNAKNIHSSHRDRVRERYMHEGIEGFSDIEFLELLLYYGISRKDTNPMAHALLDTFGSLKGVLEARPEQLTRVEGIGPQAAILLHLIRDSFCRYQRCLAEETEKISDRDNAQRFCLSMLAGQRTEQFHVISLNAQCRLNGTRKITDGSLSEVAAYPRAVVETALNFNAHSVILTHNHPGGTPRPSKEDIASTLQLQRLLGGIGIILLDHIIVAGMTTYSMVQHGDMDFKLRMKEEYDLWPEPSLAESRY